MKQIFVLIAILLTSTLSQAATPPWYYSWYLVKSTLGSDPCITVKDLREPQNKNEPWSEKNPFVLPLEVCNADQAVLLSTFVKPSLNQGALVVEISSNSEVITEKPVTWTKSELKSKFTTAFKANPYFLEMQEAMFGPTPVFKAEVVQFYCDNISVPHGICNFVAAEAFSLVLKDKVSGFNLIMATAKK